ARPGAGRDCNLGRIVRRQRSLRGIEAIDENPVESEVGREGELARRVEIDRVRVRFLLARRVDARSLVLNEAGRLAEFAVLADGQGRHAAAAVVGDECILALPVECDVTRTAALGRLLIEQGQVAGLRVDGESADSAFLARLADRVEETAR